MLRLDGDTPEPVAGLDERQIVELTALHLARPPSEKSGDCAAWLMAPINRFIAHADSGVPDNTYAKMFLISDEPQPRAAGGKTGSFSGRRA